MKKLHSVAVRFIIFFILGIVLYSGVLFAVIHSQLEKGLESYIGETLAADERGVEITITGIQDSTAFVANWVADSIQRDIKQRDGKFNEDFARRVCINAADSFSIGKAAVYDSYGKNISNSQISNGLNFSSVLNNAIAGRNNSALITTATDLYAVTGVPIKYNNAYIGAAVVYTAVSSQKLVEDISDMYDVHATYFSGYNRQYTTVPDMREKKIDKTEIIDYVMKGKPVLDKAKIGDVPYLVNYFPIKDSGGITRSVFFIGKEISAVKNIATQIFVPVLIVAIVLTIIMIGLMILVVYLIMLKKLNYVGKSIANLSSGEADLTVRIPALRLKTAG